MTNADKFKQIFGLYATELWSKTEGEFLTWLNSDFSQPDVPDTNVGEDITKGLHIPMDKQGNFRIDTGLELTPYTEPDRKAIEDEVWELVGEIQKMTFEQMHEVLGVDSQSYDYFCNEIPYQEAKAKYDAWKRQKDEIRVGDEVIPMDTQFDAMIVTRTWTDDHWRDCIDTVGFDGSICSFLISNVKKTGRHFDEVEELMKKMREGELE